jgi:ABC-2 type transport system permease protein
VSSPFLQNFFTSLSFNNRYTPFTLGIFELPNVVFFLSVSAMFLCFNVAVLDRKRWS